MKNPVRIGGFTPSEKVLEWAEKGAGEMRLTGIPADGAPAPLSLLSSKGLQTAQTAATAAGEELPAFVERAVNAQAERDKWQKLFDCMTPETE